jgi:hypothetical protein
MRTKQFGRHQAQLPAERIADEDAARDPLSLTHELSGISFT